MYHYRTTVSVDVWVPVIVALIAALGGNIHTIWAKARSRKTTETQNYKTQAEAESIVEHTLGNLVSRLDARVRLAEAREALLEDELAHWRKVAQQGKCTHTNTHEDNHD